MPKVNYTREEYVDLTPRWNLIRDCISGSIAVKKKRHEYLPIPNVTDTSPENAARYNAYLKRARFYNVTGRTQRGLVGQVFGRDPVVAMPELMDILRNDVDGAGISLDQQARKAVGLVVGYGRAGLLTDYPKREGTPATVQDIQQGDVRPIITLYQPWDIINWRSLTVNGITKLVLVVISESQVVDDDGFEQERDDYYRVLRLRGGEYWSEIWYFDEELNDFVIEERIRPVDSTGQPWKEIPFTFIGSENNEPTPNLPPLYDMADLNIGHYCNSADYEESAYILGQPTPFFTGLDENWVNQVLKGVIQLGARAAVPLPVGANAALLQAEPNTLAYQAMEHKERQMVALGAKLVEQKSVQRTATEASMEEASTTSLLATSANNVSKAYTKALTWAGQFLGVTTDATSDEAEGKVISYELNTDFDIATLPATEVAGVISAWQGQAITDEEMRDKLKRGGWAYLDDEDWKQQIEEGNLQLGVPLPGAPTGAAPALRQGAVDKLNNPEPEPAE